jgi:dihydroorotase
MSSILIKNGQVVNRGKIETKDILIKNGFIERIDNQINSPADKVIDATGKHVLPGIIDDQVHFREPGLTHKATIFTESRAAIAGGVTSFMEMPNVIPATLTQELLEAKYQIGAATSLANYSFFMGASNDNLEEVLKTNPKNVCGIKAFMGSSTGNMLVDNPVTLESLFSQCPMLIATHCEDEATIKANIAAWKKRAKLDDMVGSSVIHPILRDVDACFKSSSFAVDLAKKHNTRLHILHITTEKELMLFTNKIPLSQKRITAEVCVHHLYFNSDQYLTLGNQIKCNPAIKSINDQEALMRGLLDDRLDIIATDHAPHTYEEKQQTYFSAPAGLPLVQHGLNLMLSFYVKKQISLERIVEKMCHAPADCFHVEKRGYLDEGNWADVVIVDVKKRWKVSNQNILYKCKWSPLYGKLMQGSIDATIVSGHLAYENGQFFEDKMGERLLFNH